VKPSFVEFCKRVGIVAGAIAGVLVLVNLTAGFAWTVATRPIMDAIAAETQARIGADIELTRRLETISRDRLDLIDVMSTPFGPARDRKLVEVRARWAR
jgi:hypothetical protein